MKAVVYGAGNIGRGFIGQLLSQSGYEVVFLDINEKVISAFNSAGEYPITVVSDDGNEEIIIENVRAVNSLNSEKVVEEIFSADVMATAVGANVLKHIAKNLAVACQKRIENNKAPLNIILCENLIDANLFLKAEMLKYMDTVYGGKFDSYIGLIEASIGRMVPVLPAVENDNPLRVYVEEFDILHLDKAGFVGKIPAIKNILPYAPFNFYMERKLFIHNMCHAMAAYLGAVKGYKYISEAISDSSIKHLVSMAGITSARAIVAENGGSVDSVLDFLYKLIYRFNNSKLKDSVFRVAKDPVRKISINDRITGATKLCKKHGIDNIYINAITAALLCYKDENDEASLKISSSISKNGLLYTLKEFSGYDYPEKDKEQICAMYGMLKGGNIESVIAFCEKTFANNVANI